MGTFNIISSTINSNFTYENESLVINGSYQEDVQTDELRNINGSCYRRTEEGPGEFVGNFNGHMQEGVMRYSFNEMITADTELVLAAIAEIEQYINGENE